MTLPDRRVSSLHFIIICSVHRIMLKTEHALIEKFNLTHISSPILFYVCYMPTILIYLPFSTWLLHVYHHSTYQMKSHSAFKPAPQLWVLQVIPWVEWNTLPHMYDTFTFFQIILKEFKSKSLSLSWLNFWVFKQGSNRIHYPNQDTLVHDKYWTERNTRTGRNWGFSFPPL